MDSWGDRWIDGVSGWLNGWMEGWVEKPALSRGLREAVLQFC